MRGGERKVTAREGASLREAPSLALPPEEAMWGMERRGRPLL